MSVAMTHTEFKKYLKTVSEKDLREALAVAESVKQQLDPLCLDLNVTWPVEYRQRMVEAEIASRKLPLSVPKRPSV